MGFILCLYKIIVCLLKIINKKIHPYGMATFKKVQESCNIAQKRKEFTQQIKICSFFVQKSVVLDGSVEVKAGLRIG